MFQDLLNFSYRRTPLQAFGWYLIFLLIGLVIGALAGVIFAPGATSFTEGFQGGVQVGKIVVIPYHIILGILLLWDRHEGMANILLALAGVVLSMLLGVFGGLIPLAVLTTRPGTGDQRTESGSALATVSVVLPEDYEFENDTTQDAFRDQAQRSDWEVAAAYYPDLDATYAHLRRTSTKLALEFRATLVETKQFSRAKEIGAELQDNFLRTYFGRSQKILGFARTLIASGHKAAAKELNCAISVLGGSAD
jgi:hypothetical protein